jgi:DNA-binding transcriptional regulator YiaG
MQLVIHKPFKSTQPAEGNYSAERMTSEHVQQVIADLKAYAHRARLKQKELAKLLGVTPQQLNDWFTGHREPGAGRILQIVEFLKTKAEFAKRPKKDKP